jgi:hypothetical protein
MCDRNLRLLSLSVLVFFTFGSAAAQGWQKFVSKDRSFSFHYPKGWKITVENESSVEITNPAVKEQMLVVAIPFDAAKTPRRLAEDMIALFRQGMPDLRASDWQTTPESPTAPQPAGTRTQAAGSSEKNARAFLFVLEFALGAPLTVSQERVILAELLDGWKDESAEELRKYDQYPKLVQVILKVGQSQLEGMRGELETAVRQWINDYRGKSESVNVIESELKRRGRILAAGEPPLTEMAASAYSEITAYSELLLSNPAAEPEDIDDATVQEIRQQLRREWDSLSQTDRELIGTAPGLWICQRAILAHSSAADQEKTRAQIKRLSAGRDQASGSGRQGARDRETSRTLANNMLKHNTLMAIQQQTFNTYMWSRGFNYHPTYGRMW